MERGIRFVWVQTENLLIEYVTTLTIHVWVKPFLQSHSHSVLMKLVL